MSSPAVEGFDGSPDTMITSVGTERVEKMALRGKAATMELKNLERPVKRCGERVPVRSKDISPERSLSLRDPPPSSTTMNLKREMVSRVVSRVISYVRCCHPSHELKRCQVIPGGKK